MATKPSMPPMDPEAASVSEAEKSVKEMGSNQQLNKQALATGIIGGPDDDLTVRAYLYGVLFQAYADKVSLAFKERNELEEELRLC